MPRKKPAKKPAKKKRFRKTKAFLKVAVPAAIITTAGVLFLKEYYPQTLQAIQDGALKAYASPKDFLMSHKMQITGTLAGMFSGGRTMKWFGTKLGLKPTTVRVFATTPGAITGTYLGGFFPKTALVLALVGYKSNRKVLYRWTKKGWKTVTSEKFRERVKGFTEKTKEKFKRKKPEKEK